MVTSKSSKVIIKKTFERFLERQNFFRWHVQEHLFDLFIWGVKSSPCSLTTRSRSKEAAFTKAERGCEAWGGLVIRSLPRRGWEQLRGVSSTGWGFRSFASRPGVHFWEGTCVQTSNRNTERPCGDASPGSMALVIPDPLRRPNQL